MDPVGVLPRRSFTIRTENGVYRRISKEEMQALVRSRIQQARALAERRPRESWVLEKPVTAQVDTPRPAAPTPWNIPSPTGALGTGTRTRPAPQRTAAFQNITEKKEIHPAHEEATIEASESRYDETPLVQHRFSWSTVGENDSGEASMTADDEGAVSFSETNSVDENQDIDQEQEEGVGAHKDEGIDIVELLTDSSGEESLLSSAGERENLGLKDLEPRFANPPTRLSPSHSTRPLPESPVYNNRILLDKVVKSRQSRSASPEQNRSAPSSPSSQQGTTMTNTNATAALSPRANSPNSRHLTRQKRQEIRQARVESLLRMSLNRVRDRARNELDQMLVTPDGDEAKSNDIQRTVSLATRDIDQVVQETVQKARQAAQDEISEMLKESVLRARLSAEQEILNLVQASMVRVKAHVASSSMFSKGEHEEGEVNDSIPDEPVQQTASATEPAEEPAIPPAPAVLTRPAFMETSPPEQNFRVSVEKSGKDIPNENKEDSNERFLTGSSESPLLISESMEQAVANGNSLQHTGIKKSTKTMRVDTRPISQSDVEDFFSPKPAHQEESEWVYFEHSRIKIERPTPRRARAFPKKAFPFEADNLSAQLSETESKFTTAEAMPWYRSLDSIEQGNVRLVDGFPVVDQTAASLESTETDNWKEAWPKMGSSEQNDSCVLWQGKPPHFRANSDLIPVMSSDISLESEPPRATTDTNQNQGNAALELSEEGTPFEDECDKTACDDLDEGEFEPVDGLLLARETPTKLEGAVLEAPVVSGDNIQVETHAHVEDANVEEPDDGDLGENAENDADCVLSLSGDAGTPFDEPEVKDPAQNTGNQELSETEAEPAVTNGEEGGEQQEEVQVPLNGSEAASPPEEEEMTAGITEDTNLYEQETQVESSPEEDESGEAPVASSLEGDETELSEKPSSAPSEPSAPSDGTVFLDTVVDEDGSENFLEEEEKTTTNVKTEQENPSSTPLEDTPPEKRGPVNRPKVTFREDDDSLIPLSMNATEASEAGDDASDNPEGSRDSIQTQEQKEKASDLVDTNDDSNTNEFEDNAAKAIAESLRASASATPSPSSSIRGSPEQEEFDEPEPLPLQSPRASDDDQEGVQPKSVEEIFNDVDQLLEGDETHDSHHAAVRQVDSARGDSVISPLSLPTVYSSDDCVDMEKLRKFTASIQNTCSEGPESPCRSLPNQQEIVGVFCSSIFDVMRSDSYESQTVISLRTPSIQTFDASTLDDDNSYFTTAVETWMESVADRIEGNPPSPRQRRVRRQRAERAKAREVKELSSVAKEWFWSLSEKIDVAVDQLNDVMGTQDDDKSYSESEFEPLPLLSDIKRSSFSFSDGHSGTDQEGEDCKTRSGRKAARPATTTTARRLPSRQHRSGKNSNQGSSKKATTAMTTTSKTVPARDHPIRQKQDRRRQRGRSRQKRGIV